MPLFMGACPKCGSRLAIPQPAPEKLTCSSCHAVIKFSVAGKSGAAAPPPAAPAARVAPVLTATARTVAGYELQRELAHGGLGVVYLAYHPNLKHYRAIKRPQPRADLDNEVLLGRFVRETEALGALESKHIIRAYDAGTDADGPYLVMEYLDGESLSGLVSRHRQVPVSEACELIRQVALGLQAAHEAGLVHRDIKPSNLMLARASAGTARVTVIDWGLVKRMDEAGGSANRLTKIRTELGTPDFIAPEQVRDAHSVDIRADIYSLGATLYFLLAGQPPFHGRTDEQKQLAQAREEFPPVGQLRPDVPPNLLNVLKKMVKKEREQRYATPGEVAVALQPFAGAEPHRMLALLAPVSHAGTAPVDTGRILDERTQLALPPSAPIAPPATAPQPSSHRMIIWLVGAVSLLIVLSACILVAAIGAGLLWNKEKEPKGDGPVAKGKADEDTKDVGTKGKGAPKSGVPNVLIDEDFRDAYTKKMGLPASWKSDEFTTFKINELYGIHPVAPAGIASVLVPLSTPLSGNFAIEGVYHMDHPAFAQHHTVTISLENRKKSALLPIIFDWNGSVVIAKEVKVPPQGYKPLLPTHFLVKREGTKIRVFLDEFPPVEKNMDDAPEFDTLRLALTAGNGNAGRRLNLHGLKVVALP